MRLSFEGPFFLVVCSGCSSSQPAQNDHIFVFSRRSFIYHEVTGQSITDGSYQWQPAVGSVAYATANAVNEYPSVGGTTYSYNGDGCLTSNGVWTYGYDTEDHLVSAGMTGTSVAYVYDGFHRQAQKSVTTSGGTLESRYIYSGWQRIADYDGVAGTLQNRYVYADGLDEPLMAVSSTGVVTYYHANAQGSVIAISNSSGAVTSKNVYGTFGETSALAGTTFGFTGQRYDADTGLYYYKNRYYSPALGRFLQPDGAGYVDGLNRYAYAGNNAATYGDSLGFSKNAPDFNAREREVLTAQLERLSEGTRKNGGRLIGHIYVTKESDGRLYAGKTINPQTRRTDHVRGKGANPKAFIIRPVYGHSEKEIYRAENSMHQFIKKVGPISNKAGARGHTLAAVAKVGRKVTAAIAPVARAVAPATRVVGTVFDVLDATVLLELEWALILFEIQLQQMYGSTNQIQASLPYGSGFSGGYTYDFSSSGSEDDFIDA